MQRLQFPKGGNFRPLYLELVWSMVSICFAKADVLQSYGFVYGVQHF